MASRLHKAVVIWQVIRVSGETVYNVLLLGRTGVGKSTSGNLMADSEVFASSDSMLSVTKTCHMVTAVRDGVRLNIVDTPGMFDTDTSIEDTIREISEVAFLAPNGFHVLILQIDPFRFTQQEGLTLEYIKHITGGSQADKHMILTLKDGHRWSRERFLEDVHRGKAPEPLRELVRALGERVVPVDKTMRDLTYNNLMTTIKQVVDANGGHPYTNKYFQHAKESVENILKAVDPEAKANANWEAKFRNATQQIRLEYEEQINLAEQDTQAKLLIMREQHERRMREMEEALSTARIQNQALIGGGGEGGPDLMGIAAVLGVATMFSGCSVQ